MTGADAKEAPTPAPEPEALEAAPRPEGQQGTEQVVDYEELEEGWWEGSKKGCDRARLKKTAKL